MRRLRCISVEQSELSSTHCIETPLLNSYYCKNHKIAENAEPIQAFTSRILKEKLFGQNRCFLVENGAECEWLHENEVLTELKDAYFKSHAKNMKGLCPNKEKMCFNKKKTAGNFS